MRHFKKGFTLIEILVVISIISILSSILITVTQEPRLKARDARRIQELQQVRRALELYRAEHDLYPVPVDSLGNQGAARLGGTTDSTERWEDLKTLLSPYISLPTDPKNTGGSPLVNGGYRYYYTSGTGGSTYDLLAQFESNHPQRCGIMGYIRYTGATPGAKWCKSETGAWPDPTPFFNQKIYADH